MIEIKAPNAFGGSEEDGAFCTIFVAGTIDDGNSKDWQAEFKENFQSENIVLLNPRRDSWGKLPDDELEKQINWELDAIDHSTFVFMNFLPDSKSPITLMELGIVYSSNPSKLVVCCPKSFWRYSNVKVVCERQGISLFNDEVEAINYLKSVVNDLKNVVTDTRRLRDR